MTIVAKRGSITRDEKAYAVEVICSQLEGGYNEKTARIISGYQNEKTGESLLDLRPDETGLFRVAAILKAVSEENGDASDISQCIDLALPQEIQSRFYPRITEPGLEGLEWKSEKILQLPVAETSLGGTIYNFEGDAFDRAVDQLVEEIKTQKFEEVDINRNFTYAGKSFTLHVRATQA